MTIIKFVNHYNYGIVLETIHVYMHCIVRNQNAILENCGLEAHEQFFFFFFKTTTMAHLAQMFSEKPRQIEVYIQ